MLPIPPSEDVASSRSEPFRSYYEGMDTLREHLVTYLESDDKHHLFISTALMAIEEDEAAEL